MKLVLLGLKLNIPKLGTEGKVTDIYHGKGSEMAITVPPVEQRRRSSTCLEKPFSHPRESGLEGVTVRAS